MKYLRDKYGLIWGIIAIIGVVLVSIHIAYWTTGIGSLMVGLAYGSIWSRSLNT